MAGRVVMSLHRGILRLYPRTIRLRFAAEQQALFERVWRDERPLRAFAAIGWTIAQLWRAGRVGLACHFDRLSTRSQHQFTPTGVFGRPGAVLMRDVQLALRSLRHTPWYSVGVIGVFSLGITLATVVFAVVDGVLVKPLPYPRASELALIRVDVSGKPRVDPPLVSGREVERWAAAVPEASMTKIGELRIAARIGSRDYFQTGIDDRFFDVVGVRPLLGGFTPNDFDRRTPEEVDRTDSQER